MKRLLLLAAAVAAPAIAQQAVPRGPAAPSPPAAVDRYHEAARLYIDGQNAPALAAAEEAVRLAPNDPRAVALRDLIKQEQENKDQQQNQDQQDQNQPPQDEQPQQEPDDEGEQGPPNTPPPPGQNPQDTPSDQPQPGDERMSRDQAERILDAVGGDERQVLRQMRRTPSRARTNEQDW